MRRNLGRSVPVFLLLWLAVPAPSQIQSEGDLRREVEEAANLVSTTPRDAVQKDYVVAAAVRLLLFWVSRDDVGQGYIRIGTHPEDPASEVVQLLMGSDPSKAPLRLNNWGAATEVWRRSDKSGAFFGFMKAPKDDSMDTAREEVNREKEKQRYRYQGVITRIAGGRLVSSAVPISSPTDFTLFQLPIAQQMVIDQLKTTTRPTRILEPDTAGACADSSGFLVTVRELMAADIAGNKAPITLCFSYLSWRYNMTLRHVDPLKELKVSLKMRGAASKIESTYHNLRKAELRVVNLSTKYTTDFKIAYGDSGEIKGMPVQIEFQPNWWFRITINLKPAARPAAPLP